MEFELLDHLSKEVPVPLVLHGGSGTGDENLAKAVSPASLVSSYSAPCPTCPSSASTEVPTA